MTAATTSTNVTTTPAERSPRNVYRKRVREIRAKRKAAAAGKSGTGKVRAG